MKNVDKDVRASMERRPRTPVRETFGRGDQGEVRKLVLRMPAKLHTRLQYQRIEENRSMNEIALEAITTYLDSYNASDEA